ncbi:polyketide cyclase [Kaistella polysaccharea]|uniref:polyketide cyclase n=1 Tax=Kaistella polysaccharea TaxID=2878534 RepID=UPI001CF51195|nr:polyketide cyclase [Kaistella polysaccharea]
MRWIKIAVFLLFLLGIVYAISMIFVPENKNFTVEKEINYPVEKVFPQFSNLQNFTLWNTFFSDNKNMSIEFFTPYEGKGSSLAYVDHKDEDISGDLFIRYVNINKTLKLQLYEGKNNTPYLIDLKFVPLGEKTKIIWFIQTPKQPYLKRSLNLISEDVWLETIDKSMVNLAHLLSNKIEKDNLRENLKFDTLLVENQDSQILLGINVSAKNTKDALFKNIVVNHNKVLNYAKMDLGKKEDEYGEPILLTTPEYFKEKEVSYFYGVPLPKKEPISDNNFTFRTLNASKNYVIFYRGTYASRVKSIQQLVNQARKDSLRSGTLQEIFLEEPNTDAQVVLKLSLPVYK